MTDPFQLKPLSGQAYWRDPKVERPPRGVKMLLLNPSGVAVIGTWDDKSGWLGWSPLPDRNKPDPA